MVRPYPLALALLLTLPLVLALPLDPPGCLVRVPLGCPCLVVRHALGGCLPPSPLIVALKRGAPPPLTLHPLLQEVDARKTKMPLAASQVGHQGRLWGTCELALGLAAWCLLHIMPMG